VPAPAHLQPILAALGDGATVALAERVSSLLDQARAEAVPPDTAKLQDEIRALQREAARHSGTLDQHLAALQHALAETGLDLPADTDITSAACQVIRSSHAQLERAYAQLADAHERETDQEPASTSGGEAFTPADQPDAEPAGETATQAEAPAPTPDDELDVDWGDEDDQPDNETPAAAETDSADQGEHLAEPIADHLAAAEDTTGPSNAEIRAWCQANGIPVNARGRVSDTARAAYDTAHQGE
jgi:hypothetical protein